MSSDTSSMSEHHGRLTEAQLRSRSFQTRVLTPDTDITEHPQIPDITLICDKCGSFILLRLLQEHRKYHNALSLLEYKDAQRPGSTTALLKRRQEVVSKMTRRATKEVRHLPMSSMQKINDAYELLKAHLEETYEDLIQTREVVYPDCQGLALTCSAKCARAVGICSHENQRWKRNMEDTRVFQDYFGNDANKCFFAIYDGHNGRFSADIAANDLHHFLLNELTKFDEATSCTCTLNLAEHCDLIGYGLDRPRPVIRKDSIRHILHEESRNMIRQIIHTCQENVSNLKAVNECQTPKKEIRSKIPNKRENDKFADKTELAFRTAYQLTDYILSYGIDERSRVRWSGCSALTCVIKSTVVEDKEEGEENEMCETDEGKQSKELGVLYVANAGNSRAVLCQNGQAVRLTRKHTPQSPHERTRIMRAGGSVKDGAGGGRVNGVLDTTRGLGNHGDPMLKAVVLAEPYTLSITIDSKSQFLILASHGVWEVLSDSEAIELVKQLMPGQGYSPILPTPAEDPLRDLYKLSGLNLSQSAGKDNQELATEQDESLNNKSSQLSQSGKEIEKDVICSNEEKSTDPSRNWQLNTEMAAEDNMSEQSEFESMISALLENDDGNDADVEIVTELHTIYAQSRLLDVEQGIMTKNEMYRNLAQQMSERLVQSALLAGSRDNITVMVILLPGCIY